MIGQFFTEEENLADLVNQMPEDDRRKFQNYGHFRIEAVFVDRVFIVYKPTGLTPSKQHREPEIVTTIKVKDLSVDIHSGVRVLIEDLTTHSEMHLTHVPKKIFNLPVYGSVPVRLSLRWDARQVKGEVWRSLAFAILIKTRNKSDFYSKGNVYCETPNTFRKLYPSVTGQFTF
jgi:hypothetical protein